MIDNSQTPEKSHVTALRTPDRSVHDIKRDFFYTPLAKMRVVADINVERFLRDECLIRQQQNEGTDRADLFDIDGFSFAPLSQLVKNPGINRTRAPADKNQNIINDTQAIHVTSTMNSLTNVLTSTEPPDEKSLKTIHMELLQILDARTQDIEHTIQCKEAGVFNHEVMEAAELQCGILRFQIALYRKTMDIVEDLAAAYHIDIPRPKHKSIS